VNEIDWENWGNKKVIGKRVVVAVAWKGEHVTDGGITIPGQTEEKPTAGEVVAVGDEVTNIAVGDVVHFGHMYGAALFKAANAHRPAFFILRVPEETLVSIPRA
jgi:co-chaperonin GroES (HSP10)